MNNNDGQINFHEILEDYGLFPSFSDNRVVWKMAVFPRTNKTEVFLELAKKLNIPVEADYKTAPRIRETKECFSFSMPDYPRVVSMIEKSFLTKNR